MFKIANLFPREEKFFSLIDSLAIQAGLSAQHLQILISVTDEGTRLSSSSSIKAAKREAKRISSEITAELCRSFVTPFDREDIQDFASNIYRISKTIEKVAEFIDLHVMPSLEDLAPQTGVIIQEANAMERLVRALIRGGDLKNIQAEASLLDQLETHGDEVLSKLLVKLFKDEKDARALILKKDIYDMLERVIDRYRNAAEVALRIALKQ